MIDLYRITLYYVFDTSTIHRDEDVIIIAENRKDLSRKFRKISHGFIRFLIYYGTDCNVPLIPKFEIDNLNLDEFRANILKMDIKKMTQKYTKGIDIYDFAEIYNKSVGESSIMIIKKNPKIEIIGGQRYKDRYERTMYLIDSMRSK